MRLLLYCNRIDWAAIKRTWFITLTYPDEVHHHDYRERAKDRYIFLRDLETSVNDYVPAIWRVEWMPRKTGKHIGLLFPHWHVLVCNVDHLDEQEVREMWGKTIHYKEKDLQVKVKEVTGELGAVKYIAKYVSKEGLLDISAYHNNKFRFGRPWGVTRKKLWPISPVTISRQLTDNEIMQARWFADRNILHYDSNLGGGFTILSSDVTHMWEEMRDCT